jgi:hypothetical protein
MERIVPVRDVVLSNSRSYAWCGIAWLCLYQPIQNLPGGTEPAKPLKPALYMICYCSEVIIVRHKQLYIP